MSEKNDEAGKKNEAPPAGTENPEKPNAPTEPTKPTKPVAKKKSSETDVPVKSPVWLEPEYAGPLTGTQALARLAKFGHDVQTKPTEKASTK